MCVMRDLLNHRISRWIVASFGAAIAFHIGGLLVVTRFPIYAPKVYGVRDWVFATAASGVVGTLCAPSADRRVAFWIFIGAPLSGVIIGLLCSTINHTLEPVDFGAVLQSLLGTAVAWLFVRPALRPPNTT